MSCIANAIISHRDAGKAFASDLSDCVSSGCVHPGQRAVQHADGHRRGQQMNTLNHRPLGPAERLRQGFEAHLSTERKRQLYIVSPASLGECICRETVPRVLSVTVVNVLRHGVVIKQILKLPLEVGTESVHQPWTCMNT